MIDDFRDILAELVRAEARFMVVGAHALTLWYPLSAGMLWFAINALQAGGRTLVT